MARLCAVCFFIQLYDIPTSVTTVWQVSDFKAKSVSDRLTVYYVHVDDLTGLANQHYSNCAKTCAAIVC
jgi:hypothetical protein